MKTILLISIALILSTFSVNGESQNINNLSVNDYYMTACLDGKTGEPKDACVDWQASPVPCTNPFWPCADVVVEG